MDYKEERDLSIFPNQGSKRFLVIALIISTIITISIFLTERSYEYKYAFLLPLSYITMLILFSKIFRKPFYNYGFLFYAAQVFIFIRYVLTPYSMVISSNEYKPGPDPLAYDMNMAFGLMIYELLVIYIAITLAAYRKNKRKNKVRILKHTLPNNKIIIGLSAIILLAILINYPNSILPSQLLFIDEEFSSDIIFHGSIVIMSLLFKCIAFIFLLSLVSKNDNGRNRFLNFSVSFMTMVAFLASFTGTSRWTIIFMGIAGLIVIEKLYPKYKQMLRIGLISILLLSFISISMFKFSWVVTDSQTPIKDIILHMTSQFQAYFSGPRTVAQSLNIKEFFPNISISTFTNDFLGAVPYVSNYIDQSDRINVYFNTYNYRPYKTTLIMPLVGIGYTYFGFILAPIFTAVSQWVIIKLDKINAKETKLEFIFIYIYLGLRLSMSMGLNTQSLFSSFLLPTLPLLLLFTLNRKVSFRKRGQHNTQLF